MIKKNEASAKTLSSYKTELNELRKRKMRDTQELTKLMRELQSLRVEIEKKSQALQTNAREIITTKRENERLNRILKDKDEALQKPPSARPPSANS